MVAFKSMISVAESLLNRAKCEISKISIKLQDLHKNYDNVTTSCSHSQKSLKLHSDVVRTTAPFCSSNGEVDIPSPPKRPPTAYMVFCKENRSSIMKENPDAKGPELVKILAAKWTALTPLLKKPYEETAREGTIVYGKLHKEFYENLTDDQRCILQRMKVEKREGKKMQKLKRALKESGIPRIPNNAYTIFVQTVAKEMAEIKSGPDFIKQAAEKWNLLTEEEKKVFYETAKGDKQRYENEVTRWREKLIEEGNSDLLKSYEEGKHRQRIVASVVDSDTSQSAKKSVIKKMLSPENSAKN